MPAALVTGASTGLGREFAMLCARDGYDVILVARSFPQLETVAAAIRHETGRTALILARDLSEPNAARAVFDEVLRSGLDVEILINNAGFGLLGQLWDLDPDQLSRMLHLNVTALTDLTRLLLPAMLHKRRGRILNIASTAAFQPGPLMAVYYASKAYVLSFSQAMHNEAKPFGVTVTCLCPGPTKTEFAERAHMDSTKLFASKAVMSASEVAAQGFAAMQRGQPLLVAGKLNALGAFLTRFAPMTLTASMARRVQET